MFALDINFTDGVSKSEVLLVKRPNFVIGGNESAHVVVDELNKLGYQFLVNKDLGRKFKIKPISNQPGAVLPKQLEGVYESNTIIKAGAVSFRIYSLDGDLALRDNETPDRAGVRVMRQASLVSSAIFPALVIRTPEITVCSFAPDQIVHIGRANACLIRLDSSDISNKHARLGFESGSFWVEDLGSTNGTYVNGQQIAGRIELQPGEPVMLGNSITVVGVTNSEQLTAATNLASAMIKKPSAQKYPVLLAASEIARPARVVLPAGETLSIGRDPSSDLWLGAPHISRKHCTIKFSRSGEVILTDFSTNGTNYGHGLLRNSESIDLNNTPHVLDFGGDVTVAICFDEQQERTFVTSNGSANAFIRGEQVANERAADIAPFDSSDDLTMNQTGTNATLFGSNATIAFNMLLRNLSLPAKFMLVLALAVMGFLFWIVISLIIKML